MRQARVDIAQEPVAVVNEGAHASQQVEVPHVGNRAPRLGLVGMEEGVGQLGAVGEDEVGTALGDVGAGVAEAGLGPVDDPGEAAAVPDGVAGPIIVVDEAVRYRGDLAAGRFEYVNYPASQRLAFSDALAVTRKLLGHAFGRLEP